jgi:integrase
MARTAKLTDAKIKDLKPKAQRYVVADNEVPGLFVRVAKSGAKTFTIVARDPWKAQLWREVKGATVGIDALADVRKKAREGIRRIKVGQDPFPPPEEKPDSFETIAKRYVKLHIVKNGKRTKADIERKLKVYIYPTWRDRVLEDIKKADVTALLDHVELEHGPRQADSILTLIRAIMNWHAGRADYVPPLARKMRRQQSPTKRERVLDDDEIRAIWPVLADVGAFGDLVKLLLLTAQRRDKAAGMAWSEFADDGTWTLPRAPHEKGNGGTLPLPEIAAEVIRKQPRVGGNDHVFVGRTKGSHISGYSKSKRNLDAKVTTARRKAAADAGGDPAKVMPFPNWTLHDCRRTARSLMSRAGVSSEIAERILGHTKGGVEDIYDRHRYTAEKGAALAKLAGLILLILQPPAGNVVNLDEARA